MSPPAPRHFQAIAVTPSTKTQIKLSTMFIGSKPLTTSLNTHQNKIMVTEIIRAAVIVTNEIEKSILLFILFLVWEYHIFASFSKEKAPHLYGRKILQPCKCRAFIYFIFCQPDQGRVLRCRHPASMRPGKPGRHFHGQIWQLGVFAEFHARIGQCCCHEYPCKLVYRPGW